MGDVVVLYIDPIADLALGEDESVLNDAVRADLDVAEDYGVAYLGLCPNLHVAPDHRLGDHDRVLYPHGLQVAIHDGDVAVLDL
eukprot:CAMPEP_0168608094 /NCGR_PEP_ID=MMETSP0449_2-20121227/436_1 /TAXON_ID=1082188 /ORGANISM="Strombidium rassoulzadegani, Strain ras09" /LENGTH=83 /DNA_ID=CAMNT_0008648041 /DNA_START=820 /DNA_END=1071 /DNA_ORIENTATION=+